MTAYRKGENPALDVEFAVSEAYGSIRLSSGHIFHRKLISWEYVGLKSIVRAWRRVEEVRGRTGCCSNDFSRHYLKLLSGDGEEITMKIGEALYHHEPENLIMAIQKAKPEIEIGKPAEA